MLQTGKFSKKVSSTGKPQASFRYLAKGTWYVAARSWVLDEQGNNCLLYTSYQIIMSTDIIGLSSLERQMIAGAVRFNNSAFVYYDELYSCLLYTSIQP